MKTRACENCGDRFHVGHKGIRIARGSFRGCWLCSADCRDEFSGAGQDQSLSDDQERRTEARQIGLTAL